MRKIRIDKPYIRGTSPLPSLTIMLVVVIIFVPIVLAYQAWAYNLFKTKVTAEDLAY